MDELLNGKNPEADARLMADIKSASNVVKSNNEDASIVDDVVRASRNYEESVEMLKRVCQETGELTGFLNTVSWLRRNNRADIAKLIVDAWDEIKADQTFR